MVKASKKHIYSAGEILEHLSDISAAFRARDGGLRTSFQDACGDQKFSARQQGLLFENASATAKMEIGPKLRDLSHFLGEGLSKRVSNFDALPEEALKKNLLDIVIFSRWEAHNVPLILGCDLPKTAPPYGSRVSKLEDFQTALAYMHHSVEPAIIASLCKSENITQVQFETRLNHRVEELLEEEIAGVETLAPISPKKWAATLDI